MFACCGFPSIQVIVFQARHSPQGPYADHRALTRNAPRSVLFPSFSGTDATGWLRENASLFPPRGLGMGYCGHIPGVRANFEE